MKSLGLRGHLLLLVGLPLCLLLLAEAIVSYRINLGNANQVFDSWLVDSAQSLARQIEMRDGRLRFVASPTTIELFKWDEVDEVTFRVTSVDGEQIAGSDELLPAGTASELAGGPAFASQTIDGERTRAASVLMPSTGGEGVIITVGETLRKRNAMVNELLIEALVSKTLLLISVLPLAWIAIGRGLSALAQLNRELTQRSPTDLAPIELSAAPEEVAALVASVNELLQRIDTAMSSREHFIGNIAHQMRTPLAGIKLVAQLAEREDDRSSVRASLRQISTASDKMAHVCGKLLKLAQAETASGRGFQGDLVDLCELADECLSQCIDKASAKRMTLHWHGPNHRALVFGESALLQELLANLLENAILYGDTGGNVAVQISDSDTQVTLAVEDDGPGIPLEDRPQIFERFARRRGTAEKGTGLGLAIVREIASAHGADVALETPESGRGIRISVRFAKH